MHKILFIGLLLFSCRLFSAEEINIEKRVEGVGAFSENNFTKSKPNPIWFHFFKKQSNRKKIIASALAFPIPGGILGLHRIYLGTKPYVPLIYILTLGGGLLILPMIDFCVLISNKDISRFENHPGIFMWIDNEKKSASKY